MLLLLLQLPWHLLCLSAAATGRATERPSQLAQSIEQGLHAAQKQLHLQCGCWCTSPSAMHGHMTGGEAVIRSQSLTGHAEDQLGLVHETLPAIAAHAHMAWALPLPELQEIDCIV